jgi:hypothetical protein
MRFHFLSLAPDMIANPGLHGWGHPQNSDEFGRNCGDIEPLG